ncbi:MAG TPA: DUF167 domain-containing protein [Methanomicrobiales archaeon]|jgi:uncharacterized protein (TIGR00251 family)|nr:DUF167 domain-containing protein [Methanomicrobiales archaeon]
MESFGDAVTGDDDGVILALEVSPASAKAGFFTGYDPWRKSIRCAVRAPPERGKANREVIETLARALGIPAGSIRIISGETQSRKRVRVGDITREAVLHVLGQALHREEHPPTEDPSSTRPMDRV